MGKKSDPKTISAVADEIAWRSGKEHTDDELFAIGSQFTSDTETIDEAIRIVNERRYDESEGSRES